MSIVQLLDDVTAVNGPPVATAATGTITTTTSVIAGEGFSLNDGRGGNHLFYFTEGDLPAPSATGRPSTPIETGGIATADAMRDAIIDAVNNAPIAITAVSGGSGLVNLENDYPGPQGNQPIPDTVADAGFIVTGMTGGELSGASLVGLRKGRDSGVGGEAHLVVRSTAGSGDIELTGRLWLFSGAIGVWVPAGTGTDGGKGQINAGASMGETSSDQLAHTEVVKIQGFERAYLEVEALAGTDAAISAWLVPLAA